MPTYVYECSSCGHSFELFQSMSDAPVTVCPDCGKAVRRVIFGGSGVIFKGSGFYVNDSKKSGGAQTSKPAESAPSPKPAESAAPAKAKESA